MTLASKLTPDLKKKWLASLTPKEQEANKYLWREIHARPEQLAPVWTPDEIARKGGDWRVHTILAGRGFGKSRAASEWVRELKNTVGRIALIGETAADVRDVMVTGQSGLLSISPPWDRPVYNPSARKVTWPNGATAMTFSAEEPDSLRGPEFGGCWVDEICKFRYAEDVWSNLQMCLRLGKLPRTTITTTPRPIALLKKIIANPFTHVTRGSTYANIDNLSPSMIATLREEYEGTRIGRQEIHGEIVDDITGALWTYEIIQNSRLRRGEETPELDKIAIGVDPSGSKEGDECGIVAAGYNDEQRRAFVLADVSFQASALEWGEASVRLYHELEADVIVVESNYGGDMTERTLRAAAEDMSRRGECNSRGVKVPKIINVLKVTSTAKKAARAFPVAQLYQQNRCSHAGEFIKLEAEMREMTQTWERGRDKSPNRVDALVFAVRECIDYAQSDADYFVTI